MPGYLTLRSRGESDLVVTFTRVSAGGPPQTPRNAGPDAAARAPSAPAEGSRRAGILHADELVGERREAALAEHDLACKQVSKVYAYRDAKDRMDGVAGTVKAHVVAEEQAVGKRCVQVVERRPRQSQLKSPARFASAVGPTGIAEHDPIIRQLTTRDTIVPEVVVGDDEPAGRPARRATCPERSCPWW